MSSSNARMMDTSPMPTHNMKNREGKSSHLHQHYQSKPNQVGNVLLYGIPIVSLVIDAQERLCLAQISNTLLKQFSYNEIHNRRVALGITCVQCTPVQLEILRRAGAMPVSSRRCGMITRREAERLCKSFLGDNAPPRLPDDFAFSVHHECAWGCRGAFLPSRYNSSRAKCIKCTLCGLFFSPNKFIFHSHRTGPGDKYIQPDAANFNSWRRHMKLSSSPPDEIVHAWEDVKAMFNGGTRKRLMASSSISSQRNTSNVTPPKQPKVHAESPTPITPGITFPVTSPSPTLTAPTPRVPPFPEISLPLSRSLVMDYVWHQSQAAKQHHQFPFSPYSLPWLKRGSPLFFGHAAAESPLISWRNNIHESKPIFHPSAFRPVQAGAGIAGVGINNSEDLSDDETVDIETTEDEELAQRAATASPRPAWGSPSRIEADHAPENVRRPRTPPSSSPVVLKVESNSSPPPAVGLAIPASVRHPEPYDREESVPLDASVEASQVYNGNRGFERHDLRDRPGIGEPRESHFHRDSLKEVMNLSPRDRMEFSHRDTLWSVARMSMERHDRVPELSRPFIDNRDKDAEHVRGNSPCNSRKTDCSSCPACHPQDQRSTISPIHSSLIINENNNKITNA